MVTSVQTLSEELSIKNGSGKFIRFTLSERGIEVNPKKLREEIEEMNEPTSHKEVQTLNGRHTDRSLSFFQILRATKKLEWSIECEEVS